MKKASKARAVFGELFERQSLLPLLVAAGIRLGFAAMVFARTGSRVLMQGDTASYLEPGRNLFLHGVFATGVGPALIPEIDRTPGYPVFATVTGMFHDHVLGTIFAQVLLSLVSLMIVRRIAEQLFPDSNAGTIAAWLYALEPLSVVYTLRLMPETLFVVLLLVVIERLMAYQRSGRLIALAMSGIGLAAATYVRPISYYLGFAIALGLMLTSQGRRGHWWRAPAVSLMMCYPLLFAWQARNSVETDYGGFSSIVEKNLYFFQSAEITAELRHISLDQRQTELGYEDQAHYDAAHPEQSSWTRAERLKYMHTQATAILGAHPLLYAQSHFKGVALVALTPAASEPLQMLGMYPSDGSTPRRLLNEGILASLYRVMQSHPGIAITMAALEVFLLFVYAFAVCGCFVFNTDRPAITTLVAFALYFLLISGGAQAVGRYRLPVMPELCILAAGGLAYFVNKKKSEAA